jgi:hypothetical protein
MHEDDEKIFFVIKSKTDEYVFTNRGLLHVDGENAMSKKRTVRRHEFCYERVHTVSLETAGTIDADVEIKFSFGNEAFSIDVDKRQLEKLKDLYKTLVEVNRIQRMNHISIDDGVNGLKMANDAISRCVIEGNITNIVQDLTNFNLDWMEALRKTYSNRDFTEVFEKYINN